MMSEEGALCHVNLTIAPSPDGNLIIIAEDVTEKLIDELTKLHNRRAFLISAGQQLEIAQRQKTGRVLLFLDLDGLKRINDAHSHLEGDRALIETAEVFRETLRRADIVARYSGEAEGEESLSSGILRSAQNDDSPERTE